MDNAIKGESVVVKKNTLFNEEKVIKKPKTGFVESIAPGQRGSNLVPEYWRNKLIKIMEQLQDIGVRSHQHVRRPYLFTGSWMEGVTTIEQLFDRVKDITANEAMLRLFNIVNPFEGEMPGDSREDVAISNFYGEYYNFEVPKETRVDLSSIGNNVIEQSKIGQMQSALELSNKKNEELNSKLEALLKDTKEYDRMVADLKSRASDYESMKSQYQKLQDSVRVKDSEVFDLSKQRTDLESRLRQEIGGKDETIEALQKDVQEKDIEIQKLKKELNMTAAKLKLAEGKSDQGQISNYGGGSAKVMNRFERKRYVAQQISDEDSFVLQALLAKVRQNPPDLGTRLRNEDRNADSLVDSYEFIQGMEKLRMTPEQTHALRRIAGFSKYDEIYIEDFLELINRKLSKDVTVEKDYLTRFMKAIIDKGLTVEKVFEEYDTNHDDEMEIEELKQMTIDLNVIYEDSELTELFRLLDTNNSGGVSMDELRSKLGALQSEYISKNPAKAQQLEDKVKQDSKTKDIKAKYKNVMKKMVAVDALDDALDKNRDKVEEIDEAERLRRLLMKEGQGKDLIKNNDFEPLVGEIKVQFQKLSNVQVNVSDFKTFYMLIRLPGITKNWIEKEIYAHGLSAFKYAMRISVINVLEENIGRVLVLKLVGLNKQDLRSELGSCEILWKKGLELPNEWIVNNTYTMEGGGNII